MTCTTVKPKGTLDAMTAMSTAMSAGSVEANGPEDGDQDPDPDWYDIDWDRVEDDVRRLRQRIFAAARDGDHQRVRNLQKLTAPRGALSYPRSSREELEGRFLG